MMNKPIIKNTRKKSNSFPSLKQTADVASWIRFIREIGLPEMFATLPDRRQQAKIEYSISSLALWSFSAVAFRLGSKNAMQTTVAGSSKGIPNLLGIDKSQSLPHSSTVDHALSFIEAEHLNKILLKLFKRIIERKFFYNHADLLVDNVFHIGVDGYWIHKYEHPHAKDAEGHNTCPYCLCRKQNKGTDKEKTYWVHVLVTFVLIFENFTLPLYTYALKANQIDISRSDENLKEECELKAAHIVLPMLKEYFPRTRFTFLGDALYANRPFIRLCKELGFEYIIVLKEQTLKNLNKKCKELSRTELYQKHYTHIEKTRGIELKGAWFNEVDVGEEVVTHVLRFEEKRIKKEDSCSIAYKGAWMCSKKIFHNNCFKWAKRGRMRWNHEDLHQTCKRRGFEIKHDMARADPNLQLVWKLMIFIAYFVFELFRFSEIALAARKTRSLMKFARDMLEQLVNIPWEIISQSLILKKPRVQFRFNFNNTS